MKIRFSDFNDRFLTVPRQPASSGVASFTGITYTKAQTIYLQATSGSLVTCAIIGGGVQCWGLNGQGQLGNNSTITSLVPVQVQGLSSGATQVTAGQAHACALVSGGVQCWGYNAAGQLGDNSVVNSSVPVPVNGLSSNVSSITGGSTHKALGPPRFPLENFTPAPSGITKFSVGVRMFSDNLETASPRAHLSRNRFMD
jgi:hypothetical protein